MEEINKSYYAIIPATIRYDNDLCANAKLLYGEITALCNEKGYCWANNDYFSQLYQVSKKSISRWVKQLLDKGYISSEIIYEKDSKKVLNRYLKIGDYPMDKNVLPYGQKKEYPTDKKVTDNNTYNNTLNSILDESKINFKKPTLDEVKNYCIERNNGIDYQKWFNYYTANGWKVGKNPMKDWKAAVRTWESNNDNKAKESEVSPYGVYLN